MEAKAQLEKEGIHPYDMVNSKGEVVKKTGALLSQAARNDVSESFERVKPTQTGSGLAVSNVMGKQIAADSLFVKDQNNTQDTVNSIQTGEQAANTQNNGNLAKDDNTKLRPVIEQRTEQLYKEKMKNYPESHQKDVSTQNSVRDEARMEVEAQLKKEGIHPLDQVNEKGEVVKKTGTLISQAARNDVSRSFERVKPSLTGGEIGRAHV